MSKWKPPNYFENSHIVDDLVSISDGHIDPVPDLFAYPECDCDLYVLPDLVAYPECDCDLYGLPDLVTYPECDRNVNGFFYNDSYTFRIYLSNPNHNPFRNDSCSIAKLIWIASQL